MLYIDVNGFNVSVIGRSHWAIKSADSGVSASKKFNLLFYIMYFIIIAIIYIIVGIKNTILPHYLFALAPCIITCAVYDTVLRLKGRKWKVSLIELVKIEVSESLTDTFYNDTNTRDSYTWSARFLCKNSQGIMLHPDDRQRNFLTESQALYALSRVIEDGRLRVRKNPKDPHRCFVDW